MSQQASNCCSCTTIMAWGLLLIAAAGWVIYAMADSTAPAALPSLITASIASTLFLILLLSRMFD